ncbi:hypothetical protein DPMN_119455 [Dreissena polymorpha]|uniref:Uncharacterized protein n=1 Tax=Dreissena polymorpha TaxID=45954 RepID=A0A9D4GIN6_DREPO|nr:hypothetical protein DPMN_119455 [Dreissena polymorpha]
MAKSLPRQVFFAVYSSSHLRLWSHLGHKAQTSSYNVVIVAGSCMWERPAELCTSDIY